MIIILIMTGIQTERSAQHQLSQQQEHWRAAMEHNKQVFDVIVIVIFMIIAVIIIVIIFIINKIMKIIEFETSRC